MLALEALSRFSLGDAAMVDRIVDAGVDGYAQQILSSLASVRRRSDRAATALAPWLESREYLAATIMAAAVAGVVLPEGHALAAHAALVSGVRIRCED